MKLGNGVSYIPERGDIVWINFNPQKGHEQAGRRPAIIIFTSKLQQLGRAGNNVSYYKSSQRLSI